MITNKDKNKERMKQASFIPKPNPNWFHNGGNPEQMGLHQMQKNKNKRKKK
jgi:hypothetical protein